MPNIAIFVSGARISANGITLFGPVWSEGQKGEESQYNWFVEVAWTATQDEINKACRAAAISALQAAGITIGTLDNKMLFGAGLNTISLL